MLKIKAFLTAALLAAGLTAFGQQVTVTGVVTSSADGYGVIGAAVMEKGTSNGVVTDFDGNFTLRVELGKTLEISCIGYRTIEVAAAENMAVVLDEDVAELSEVVVTGYQTQRKADLTGSISVIKTDEMKTTSGLNSLNTNDIESMQVLKDAASASIYGSRAALDVLQRSRIVIHRAELLDFQPGTSGTGVGQNFLSHFPGEKVLVPGGQPEVPAEAGASSRIHVADTTSLGLPLARVRIVCSKGTYIRAFARDLGEALGSGAHLDSLVRTRTGDYSLENALSLQDALSLLAD